MPKIHVVVPHSSPPEQVILRARQAIEKSVGDFQGGDLKLTSTATTADFSFRSMGFTIKGRVEATPSEIITDIELPLAALMFKEMAENAIRTNIEKAVKKAEAKIEDQS